MTPLDEALHRLRTISVPARPSVETLAAHASRRRRRRAWAGTAVAALVLAGGVGVALRGDADERRVTAGPPSPEATASVGSGSVPDVVGRTVSDARSALRTAGLAMSVSEGDPAAAAAVVVAMEPGPGGPIASGSVVGVRTALPDPPIAVECPDARHPRDAVGTADGLPRGDGLERSAAEATVLRLRQQASESSGTQVYLGIWDRWAYFGDSSVAPAEGFQVIVVLPEDAACPGVPSFQGVPVTYVVGPIEAWAGIATAPDERELEGSTQADRIAERFLTFARASELSGAEQVPFAATVRLGLGNELRVERTQADLLNRSAWVLSADGFRARSGSVSILDEVPGDELEVTVGDHATCVGDPVPGPRELAGLVRISIQPRSIGSCLQWFAIDLYIDANGLVAAVTLDVFEP